MIESQDKSHLRAVL